MGECQMRHWHSATSIRSTRTISSMQIASIELQRGNLLYEYNPGQRWYYLNHQKPSEVAYRWTKATTLCLLLVV